MTARLDHAVVVVRELGSAVRELEAAGFTVVPGGRHDVLPTENALVVFADGGYLELLATREPATRDELRALRDGEGWDRHLRGVSAVARRFLPLLAGPDGVADWVIRSQALARDAARLRSQGVPAAGPVAMQRMRPDGVRLAWDLLLPESFRHPFVIADRTPREQRVPTDAAVTTHANGARGIAAVQVRVSVVPIAALELGESLGVTPRLGAEGASRLDADGWRVELHPGEPEGACGVTIAGCATLPAEIGALGVHGEGANV